MKTKQQLIQYVATHLHQSDSTIRWNLRRQKLSKSDVASLRAEALKLNQAKGAAIGVSAVRGSRPVSQLLDQFDDVKKVKQRMKTLPSGEYLDDEELRRELKLTITRWRDVRGHSSLQTFLYKLPNNRFVWMHPKDQEKMTAAINLNEQ